MKNRNLFGLSILYLLFSTLGCGDDPITSITENNNLIGTWKVIAIELQGTINGLTVNENPKPSGTITFDNDFSGKENYSYTIRNIEFKERDSFNWVSTSNAITFNLGDNDEQQWERLVNEANRQQGTYKETTDDADLMVTLTLEK